MPRGVKATAGDSSKSLQYLEALPRKELQALAKELGVKANGKSAEIIAGVRAAQSTSAAHEPPAAAADDATQAEQHVEEEEEEQVARKVTRGKTKIPTAAKATMARAVRGKAKRDDAGSAREVEPAGDEQPQHAHSRSKASKPSQRATTTTAAATTTTLTTATTSSKSREVAAAAAAPSGGRSTATAVRGGAGKKAAAGKATDAASGKAVEDEAKGSVVVDAVDKARADGGKGRAQKGRQQEQRVEEDEPQDKEEEAAAESVKPKATRSAAVAANTASSCSTSTNSGSSNRRGRSTAAPAAKAGARGPKGSAKKAGAEEIEEEALEHTMSEPAAEQGQQQPEKAVVEVATTKVRRTKKAPATAPVQEKAEVAGEEEGSELVVESQREPPTARAPAAKGRKGRGGAATAKTKRAQAPLFPPPPRNAAHEQDLSEQAKDRVGEEEGQKQQEEGEEVEEEHEEPVPTADELRAMSCVALRALAKRLGVKASSTRKADLINALRLSRACDTTSDPQPAAAVGAASGGAAAEGREPGCRTATESETSVVSAAGESDGDQRMKQQPRRASLRLASQTDPAALVRDQKDTSAAQMTPTGEVDLAKQRRQELLREKKEARDLERKNRVLKKTEKHMRDIGLSKTPYHDTQKRKLLGRKDDPHKPWFRGFRVKHDVKGGDGDKKPAVTAVPRRIKAARRAQRIEKETQEACERLEKSFAKRYVRAEHRDKIKDTGVRKAQQNRRDKFVSKSRTRRSVEYARNREAAMLTLDDAVHAQTPTSDTTYAQEGEAERGVGLDGAKVGGRRSGGARRRSSVGSIKPLGPLRQGRGSLGGGSDAGGAAAVQGGRGSDIGAPAEADKRRSGGIRRSSGRSTTTTTTITSDKKHSSSSDHSGAELKKSPVGSIVKRSGSGIRGSGRRSVEAGGARKSGFVVDDMPSPPVC